MIGFTRFSLLLFLLGTPFQRCFAFPEMVRHGYTNCIACHVSPNGGGILTPYGRSLSAEVLSAWGNESESKFLYGAISLPEWLNLGGDFRAVQTYLNSSRIEQYKFIFMQADLEAAASMKEWQVVAALGADTRASGGTLLSRRHYIHYRPLDPLSLRIGRFQSAMGINTADHVIATKRALNWDEGSETYNFEAAWLGDPIDAFLTAVLGRPDAPELDAEKGIALRSGLTLGERFKIGFSYFYGSSIGTARHVLGPHAILGITPRFFILAELDFQKRTSDGTDSLWGAVDYLRVNYELLRGLHIYLTQEWTKLDFNDARSATETYGLGLQFFPRPHLEVQATFQKQRNLANRVGFYDFAWILFHFYP